MIQPKIRFNGFSDEWAEKDFRDVIKLDNIMPTDMEKKLPVLTSSRQGLMNQSDYYKDRLVASKDLSKYHVLSENAITYRQMSDDNIFVFNQNKLGFTGLVSPAYPVIKNKNNIALEYLIIYLNNSVQMKRQIHLNVEGSTRTSLPFSKLSEFPIQLPTLPEQQKIGALFSKYDAIISLREQKLEELNALKKGMLQQMFPKNGEKVPELRFAGFADDWEERKLKDISDYRNGKAHEQVEDEQGKFTIINSKFVSTDGKVKRNTCMQVEPMFKGELAVVLSDLPNGKALAKVFLVDENDKYTLNQRIAGINPNESVNSTFLKYRMNRHSYFLKFDSGVSQTNLSKSQVEEFATLYPTLPEQQKIGQLFKQLDARISNEQAKIAQLKVQKQGLLQKML